MEEFDILCKIYKCNTMKHLEFYNNNVAFVNIAREQCSSHKYKKCPFYQEPLVFVKKKTTLKVYKTQFNRNIYK